MMAASSSSSNLSDHLVQDDLPWPASSSSSSLQPFAPAPHHHSAIFGGNQLWCQQPLTLNCADRHHCEELEVLLSAQGGHHHSHSISHHSPVISPQLSSLLMMQDLGFQWSNCGNSFVDTSSSSMPPMNGQQHDNCHNKIKDNSSRSSCASTAIAACHDDMVLDGGGGGGGLPAMAVAADLDGATAVLPSVNISRTPTPTPPHQRLFQLAAPPPLPGDAFEILASSRLCKTLLLSQASSVLLHNGMVPLLRSEHVPYGPPAGAAHPHGPSIDNYKQMGASSSCVDAAGGGRHWSAEHDAACQSRAAAAAARPVPSSQLAPSSKKPRVEQRSSSSSTIVPSFKEREIRGPNRCSSAARLTIWQD
ncbi:hypothetical protein BDA96_03G109500 [Sorghum bicolor]|uniref:Uncharacterized protein n=1 Tax=Sorghum bicolor TaxID=4558 RepID=A0A921RAM7_SORBI|nr:hypothetical protein BDA96_03G109500 [Sorghum bicolor]